MQNPEIASKGRFGSGTQVTQCGAVLLRGLMAAFVAFAFMSIVPVACAQSGPVVWVVPSLQRVGPDDAAGGGTQAQLSAARGEYESFQIVVKAPGSGALSNVNVSVTDLTGPGGQVIARQNLSLFREQYVNVTTSSPNWGGANQPLPKGWYPDGLIPFIDPSTGQPPSASATLKAVPFSLGVSKNQPIWVDVLVPRNVAAGYYTGTYTVTSDQGSVTGQISLTVWNFTLPLKPSEKSSFLFWSAGTLPAIQELLRNKVNPERVPTANQRSLIDGFGLTSQETGYWSGADIGTCSMSSAPSVSSLRNTVAAQQPDLFLYNYTADEIDRCSGLYPTMKQWGYNLHQAGIDNLVTMAPVPDLMDDGSGTGRSAVDIWVMLPVVYDGHVSNVKTAQAKGDEAWSYNCLVQDSYSPKWMIDFAPINFRIQPGFINQSLGLKGILYWRIDLWSSDPWNNPYTGGFSNYPGEGSFVYPGSTVGIQGVAPSMRLKWLRDGIEDYEYIELLKQAGQSSWALQVAAGVGANWSQWTRDINVLANARQQLGQQLDGLGGGSSSLPGAPGNPSPQSGATGVSLTPTLSWAAASAATSYDVYFGTSSSPAMAGSTSGTSYNPGSLSAGATYYWRVVARNSAGSTSSATWSFTTQQATPAPGTPANPSPANGATGVSASASLAWSAATNCSSYDVYFGGSSSPGMAGSTSGTSYNPGSLSAGTTYYWRVVAKNSAGATSSATWSFTTASAAASGPPAPMSVTPSSGSGLAQTFEFNFSVPNGLANANVLINTAPSGQNSCWFNYNSPANSLSLANDSASTWTYATVGSQTTLQNSQCSISAAGVKVTLSSPNATVSVPVTFNPAFAGQKNIYMRVQDQAGAMTSFTAMGTWTVQQTTAAPGTPANPSPASGAAGIPLSSILAWSAASGATSYDVYFGASSSPAMAGSASGTSYNPGTLSANTTYYWRVVAKNSAGSTSSATWSFTTQQATPAPGAPANPSPANGATGVLQTTALAWSAASYAASYDVYFGTSSSPAMAGSTSATSYNPGALSANTKYYWRVVARNSAGSTSSATWSFTTASAAASGPPAPVSVTPSSGSGLTQTFAFAFSVPKGLANANVLINRSADGRNACWFNYNSAGNSLSLARDNSSAWDYAALGSGVTLKNSQCQIPVAGVSVTVSGSQVILTVPLTFTAAFAGQNNIYLRVQDQAGTMTSFSRMGTWTVPSR